MQNQGATEKYGLMIESLQWRNKAQNEFVISIAPIASHTDFLQRTDFES